jgi:hypothetical protein
MLGRRGAPLHSLKTVGFLQPPLLKSMVRPPSRPRNGRTIGRLAAVSAAQLM